MTHRQRADRGFDGAFCSAPEPPGNPEVTHCHRPGDGSRLDLSGASASRQALPDIPDIPEETRVPKTVIPHAVVDIDRWLPGKAERVEIIN
jgi:hypothetical protein